MALPVSPLAPAHFPRLSPVAGVRWATAAAGIRYQGRTDLLLVSLDPGTTVAGVLTTSKTRSAPVEWCAAGLKDGSARAVVINAGNANAFTGLKGEQSVARTAHATAAALGCAPSQVFISSTGTIGEFLPDHKITEALPGLVAQLAGDDWLTAAQAIMTTDTFPKGATRTAAMGGVTVTLSGIAKGSGMIAPDMATLLAYVFTDAAIPAATLQSMLSAGADASFNAITVDGDTSTSDTLLLFATGKAGNPPEGNFTEFSIALNDLLKDLACQVVRDGEGASKFIEITVTGAESDRAARTIALTIANSPLVKTAIAGEDANWGRIVAAVGRAGEAANRDAMAIVIGGVQVAKDGLAVPDYDETPVVAHMKGQNIDIAVDVGVGEGRFTVWTCDLTHGYIDINGSYRT